MLRSYRWYVDSIPLNHVTLLPPCLQISGASSWKCLTSCNFFHHTASCAWLPWPGTEPAPPAVEAQSLDHWTARKALATCIYGSLQWLIISIGFSIGSDEHSSGLWKRNRKSESSPNQASKDIEKNSGFVLMFFFCCLVSKSCQTLLWPHGLSMGFSRLEYCSGLPFPPPGGLPDPGTEAQLVLCLLHCRQVPYCWAAGEAPSVL